MTLRNPTQNVTADADAVMARSLPQDCVTAWHVEFLTAVKRRHWKDVQEEKEGAHRVTGGCQCGEDSIPGVDPEIGPRMAALRTVAMRLLPTLRQACTRPADHKEPSVSVVPSLPHCGDRPASASAGTFFPT
ncbi:hypothetical protein TcYC6_0014940 [Trypanosoma cruzi]|nr:hypothetical protein TcYC6_0014940 [Trypanosoma cruzi]